MYSITTFKSIFDTDTSNVYHFKTWVDLCSLFLSLATNEVYKPKKGERPVAGRKKAILISSAIYEEGTTRANRNVVSWSKWVALDIDSYDGDYKDVIAQFDDYNYIIHSTGSSTKEHPKFRVILELNEEVPSDKIRVFWHSINKTFGSYTDEQTKDLSRMFYCPGIYPNAYNFIYVNSAGKTINWREIVKDHEDSYIEKSNNFFDNLPKEVQEQLLEHRKNACSRNVTWTSWKNCPFINKKLLQEYVSIAGTDGTGRYHFFYKIMVSIATNAISNNFDITSFDIIDLMRSIDEDNGNLYVNRSIDVEANRAIEYAYKNSIVDKK